MPVEKRETVNPTSYSILKGGMSEPKWGFYEFFAGGGMARIGLGEGWRCLFANELCAKKAYAYRLNFGPSPELTVDDVRNVTTSDLPSEAMLAWGSFPCQDLSQAGNGIGLEGGRSGAFLPFWNLMDSLVNEGRGVPIVVLENVIGTLSSNEGRDFASILDMVVRSGYRAGAVVLDAVHFIPQSRPRLFIIAVRAETEAPSALVSANPVDTWHPRGLCAAQQALPENVKKAWLWWKLPRPPSAVRNLGDLIDEEPEGVRWHTSEETERLLSMMSETNLHKLAQGKRYGRRIVGTAYKRIRRNSDGARVQRAEVRFDQVSGCLRTPVGGSSRQLLLVVKGESVRSRLLSPREAARLMGLPDTYRLPAKYNDAYHVAGDGLAIPVVQWLERHLLQPLASADCPVGRVCPRSKPRRSSPERRSHGCISADSSRDSSVESWMMFEIPAPILR